VLLEISGTYIACTQL